MNLEKNVSLYEEIFHILAGDEISVRRLSSLRNEDALPEGRPGSGIPEHGGD